MIALNREMLVELGLGQLSAARANQLLRRIYAELELRVGTQLVDQMSNEQFEQFDDYFQNGDDAGAFAWLEGNFPNYGEVVRSQFDQLKDEISANRNALLAAAARAAAVPPIRQTV
jgi:hypothetical protein